MKLVFYGAGNMAQAIFTGIINSNNLNANDIYLTNKSNEQALKSFAEKLGLIIVMMMKHYSKMPIMYF